MKTTTPNNAKYDWDAIFKRKGRFSMTQGIDFECQPYAMDGQIRNQASKRGKRVSIITQGRILSIEIIG